MQPVSQDRLVGSGPSESASLAEPHRRPEAPAIQYDAFISYSHAADDRLAPALRSGLQRFATPWRLFRLTNPVRSLRIFQDTASLSANPELWPTIERALMASDWFVLLASPDAAASPWVGKEVTVWCRHKSPAHLLIVQTAGEISWDGALNDFDWTKTDAVPQVLSGAFREEPRWVDARFAHTEKQVTLRDPRFRDLVAEIAAPLRGIPKDDLIGEDIRQHRRLNFWRNAGVASLSALLIVATLAAVIAIQQLHAAERNFKQAVGSADTLVTQVAQRLRPLTGIRGVSADTVREILVKAEEIFKRLTDQVPESRELRDRKAAMLMAFAEISGALNDTAERRRRAEEAYRIMQGLVDEKHKMQWLHPIMRGLGLADEELDKNHLIHGLAMSQLTLGDALEAQGDLAAALSAYRSDQATMQRLVDKDPANVRWKRDLAISQAKVGFVLSTQGDLAGASAAWRDSHMRTNELLEQSASDPQLLRNLSSSQFMVSYADTESSERLLDAMRAYQTTMERLAQNDPGNNIWQDDLASIHNTIASFLQNQGDLQGARQEHQTALNVMEGLASKDPHNVNWQAGLAHSAEGVSNTQQIQGDINGARAMGAKAMEIWQNLANQDANNPEWKYRVAMNHVQLAGAKRKLDDHVGAISSYSAAESVLKTLTNDVNPNYVEWQYQLALTKHMSGSVSLEHSEPDEARAKFLEGNRILQDLKARDPSNIKVQSLLAQSLSSLAMAEEHNTTALRDALDAHEIRKSLVAQHPDNPDLKYELADSHDNVGNMLRAQGDLDGALSHFRQAQGILESLTEDNSGLALWRVSLIRSYCNVAEVWQAKNQSDNALTAYRSAEKMTDSMSGHIDNDTVQFSLKRVYSGRGSVKWAQGDIAGALSDYEASESISEQQAARYPGRDDLQSALALNQTIIGHLRMRMGDQIGTLVASRAASEILEGLVRRYPDNMQMWARLKDNISSVTNISHTVRRYGESAVYGKKWVDLLREHQTGKNKSELASALGNLSWHYIFNRQFDEAAAAAKEGYVLDQKQSGILINLAHAEMFLGQTDAAMELHKQHLNDVVHGGGNKGWKEVVINDFADFKEAGLQNPNMLTIEHVLTTEK